MSFQESTVATALAESVAAAAIASPTTTTITARVKAENDTITPRYRMSTTHHPSQSFTSKRDRSRSRSPNQKIDEARRDRMARLRADDIGDDDDDNGTRNNNHYRKKSVPTINKDVHHDNNNDDDNDDDQNEGDVAMAQLMGFSGFASTKGEPVQDNQKGAARGAATKNKARKYRQYMNRKGGFNRELDKMP